MTGPHDVTEADASALDLASAAPAAHLLDQLVDLAQAGGAERLALGKEAPGDVDGDASAERGGAAAQQGSLLAGRAEPQVGVGDELGAGVGVLAFDEVDVVDADPRVL